MKVLWMHKYCSPPQKLGITFLLKLITYVQQAKNYHLKIKFCSMQFKFSIRFEKMVEQ
jgi:hypothetical protein